MASQAGRRRRRDLDGAPVALRLGFMLLACILAGVAAAGVLFPVIGGLAGAAAHQSDTFTGLPAELKAPPLPEHSVLLDSSGKVVIATLRGPEDRITVTLDKVPTVMQQAIISIEDSRFYEHHGVDLKGILRAIVKNNQGGDIQGASTLTQQYVKNVLLEEATTDADRKAAIARNAQRKIKEARYALQLEHELTKAQILERYLNIAYFGEGVYGVGTAAQHYFGVNVQSLTLPQAALLAGLVNNPTGYDPINHPLRSTARRKTVLEAMLKQKYIDQAQFTSADAAKLTPPETDAHKPVNPDACVGSVAPWFCDYARSQLLNDPVLGRTAAEREDRLFNGGLRIRTTLDLTKQKAAQQAVDANISHSNRVEAVQAMVQPGTGYVQAIAVSRTYGPKKEGSTDNELKLASLPTFQGGSTFKMFTLATALAKGIGIHTKINAPACYASKVFDNPKPQNCFKNAGDSEAGTFDLTSGTWFSVNTFFVQLEERVGVQDVIDTAVKMGIPRQRFHGLGVTSGSVTLGAVPDGVAPIELADAYATVAAHGVHCDTTGVMFLQQKDGSRFNPTTTKDSCKQVIDAGVADTVSSILQGVLTQPRATAAGKGIGRPAAGKTGTLDSQAAAWFVGFTPQLVSAVVLGDPAKSSLPMGPVQTVSGASVYPVFGGTIPATIWQQSMIAAMAGLPVQQLPPPSSSIALGDQIQLPNVVGLSPQQAAKALTDAGFGVTVDKKLTFSDTVPRGAVAGSNPGAGFVNAGTTVDLFISNGPSPTATKSPTPGKPKPSVNPGPGIPINPGTTSPIAPIQPPDNPIASVAPPASPVASP